MGKALVIKNADFGTNAVATITFSDIDCTGISFSTDTINITGTDPVTVSYTVTPEDTTDVVVWESSDASVVTANAGTLTVEGIGTCTITATCGNYSATATVNVSISYIGNFRWARLQTNTSYPGTLVIYRGTYNYISAIASESQETQYPLVSGTAITSDQYPIKCPKNTASITIKVTNASLLYSGDTDVYWFKDESAAETPNKVAYISKESAYSPTTYTSKTFELPSTADSVAVTVRLSSVYESTDSAATIMESAGFSIDFNVAD